MIIDITKPAKANVIVHTAAKFLSQGGFIRKNGKSNQ
jgi:O-acetyl-ADP-ribose deacetylase (regulator of RNase III)